jgi:hypothetical protein
MPPKSLLFALLPIVGASACADPKCPPPYMQFGDRCRLCPPGETREQGKCVPLRDGGEHEPGERDECDDNAHPADAAEDAGASTVDAPDLDGSITHDAQPGIVTEPDDGGVHRPDGAPDDANVGADDGALDVGECASRVARLPKRS